jgi:hypothetical protein
MHFRLYISISSFFLLQVLTPHLVAQVPHDCPKFGRLTTVNNELEGMWKEAIVASYAGITTKILSHDCLHPKWDSVCVPTGYDTEELPNGPTFVNLSVRQTPEKSQCRLTFSLTRSVSLLRVGSALERQAGPASTVQCTTLICLSFWKLLVLASIVILISKSLETHGHISLFHYSGSHVTHCIPLSRLPALPLSFRFYWAVPPLWSSGQSSWLQIRSSGFASLSYQIFWEVMGLERGPLSLKSTIDELSKRKSRVFGLENWDYFRWGSAMLTTRHPSIQKRWQQRGRQAAVARSV